VSGAREPTRLPSWAPCGSRGPGVGWLVRGPRLQFSAPKTGCHRARGDPVRPLSRLL